VPLLASKDELQEIIRKAGSEGQGVLVLFKMQQCRKCSLLAPKFERLARDYGDRNTVWVMVNADKMDKSHRAEYNLKIVPAVQYFSKSGERLVEYIAVSGISQVLVDVGAMVEKHGEVRQTGRSSDLRATFEEGAEPQPVSTRRLIRSDLRAGVRKSTSKIILQGA
jgi:thioredoxin-like negative regulator of GroEL